MSLNEMRLANILFEPEDKYVHSVNEAILNEAVEDVQGYIESLNMLKNGLVGHPKVINAIDELQDKLIEAADEGSGRLSRVFGNKTTKLATAASELTKNLFDLYKKISLSPKVKPQFELSKTKLQSSQLALKITFTPTPPSTEAPPSAQPPSPTPPPAPTASATATETSPEVKQTGTRENPHIKRDQEQLEKQSINRGQTAPTGRPKAVVAHQTPAGAAAADAVEDPDVDNEDGTEKMNELRSRLRKLIIKEIYSLSLQSLFKDDFKFILSEAASPPGLSKSYIKFDKIPADADDSDSILSDLMILHKPSSATNVTYDFSSLKINGIDEIEIPSDVGEIYITGLGSDNDAAPLPERFSSNVSLRTPDRALGNLEFNKLEPIIKKSVESINKSLKKAGANELPSTISNAGEEFASLKMLQFTSNYKLLEKMMATPATSSGLSGSAAAAAGAAAVGAAAAGLAGGGASGGSGGSGGSAGGGRGAPRHSLKNALSGIGIDDTKIEVIKDRINPLVGYIFNESVSYDQNRLEVLAGIRKK